MTFGEMYDAVAKGTVDGGLHGWEGQGVLGIIDLIKYSTQVDLGLSTFVTVMNLGTWKSLPSDLQKLFTADPYLLAKAHGMTFDSSDLKFKTKMEQSFAKRGLPAIYVPPDTERARFTAAVKSVYDQWLQKAAAIVGQAKAEAILADCQKFAKQYEYNGTASPEVVAALAQWGSPWYPGK